VDHTRSFKQASDAYREYHLMKSDLEKVMNTKGSAAWRDVLGWETISDFVARFP
jgi:hypothetical protein